MDGSASGEAVKRDTIIATTYAGALGGMFIDRFIIGANWGAFVVVVVGVIAIGALHVHRAQESRREKHQTHWPL